MSRPSCCLPLVLALACTGGKGGDDTGADDTGADAPQAENGLPEGPSTWSGEATVGTFAFPVDFELDNDGGDLTATATIRDNPEAPLGLGTGVFTLTGTHEPGSGLVALAPDAWVSEPDIQIELIGFAGVHDPSAGTLVGTMQDYASGSDNSLAGGPAHFTMDSGDGAPTAFGDLGASLAAGEQAFSGTLQCSGPVRELSGSLRYDGAGAVSGTLTVGDTGLDTPLGSFAFTGVHNPSTGGLTLVPGLWIDPDHNTVSFFVDGTYDAGTGAWEGDQRTNTDACPDATWHVTF